MIKEFGIEPELLNSSASFYFITSFFGIDKWRLIREFPENWGTKVRQSWKDVKPKEKQRLLEQLVLLNKQTIKCFFSKGIVPFNYDNNLQWVINAEKYHLLFSFDAAISYINPNGSDFICRIEDMKDDHPLIDNSKCFSVKREAINMAQCVKTILSNAKEIHFVDRRFEHGGIEQKYLRPLKEFIKAILERENFNLKPLNRIVYHTADRTLSNNLINCLTQEIKPLLKNNIGLEIIRWPYNHMHNRFILTDIGGVVFQEGLDDWNFGTGREFDDINPITIEACKLKIADTSITPYMSIVFDQSKDLIII